MQQWLLPFACRTITMINDVTRLRALGCGDREKQEEKKRRHALCYLWRLELDCAGHWRLLSKVNAVTVLTVDPQTRETGARSRRSPVHASTLECRGGHRELEV